MKIIRPLEVTDARLTATNVPENDEAEYASGTAYSAGQRVMVTDTDVHIIYEALRSTTGEYPPDNTSGTDPAWLEVGSTNRWAMFDGIVGTTTTNSAAWTVGTGSGIQVEVTPDEVVNAVAFFGLLGNSINVAMIDPTEGEVYNRTENLVSTDGIDNYYSWFFEPIERRSDVAFTDLPSYGTADIRISIDGGGSATKCSLAIPGIQRDIGATQYGASASIIDYSRKEVDTFGRFLITERAYSKRMSVDIVIDRQRVDFVQRLLTTYRTTPVVWSGADDYGALLVYGYYRDFDTVIANYSFSECSIEIEGLT